MRSSSLAFVIIGGIGITCAAAACVGADPNTSSPPDTSGGDAQPGDVGATKAEDASDDAFVDGGEGGAGVTSYLAFVTTGGNGTQARTADERCKSDISRLGPTRRALAWMALGGESPLVRLGTTEGRWVSPSGRVIFPNRAAIVTTGPVNPIDEDINKQTVSATIRAWTGLVPDGGTCNEWSSASSATTGGVGSRIGETWAAVGTGSCTSTNHVVMCLEY